MIKGSLRFFSRTSAGKAPLDLQEIRAAFVNAEGLIERIGRFRDERIGRIVAHETPIPISDSPCMVLHVVPVQTFASRTPVDPASFRRHAVAMFPPLSSEGGWAQRINLDGLLTFNQPAGDEHAYAYAQLFRSGAIEAVDAHSLAVLENGQRVIASVYFEREIAKAFHHYTKAYMAIGAEAPWVVMLSFIGVKGYSMSSGHSDWRLRGVFGIDRDILLIPDIVVEEYNDNPFTVLKPAFDIVWQACGFGGSANYDKNEKYLRLDG